MPKVTTAVGSVEVTRAVIAYVVMEVHDLAEEYRAKADEELLRLATELERLAPEARDVLRAELARRRIDTRERLEKFRAEERSIDAETREPSYAGHGFIASLRDWKRYQRRTGEWPIVSIVALLIKGVVLLGTFLFFLQFVIGRDWSSTKLLLVFGSVYVGELYLWYRIQKKIRLRELRAYRNRRRMLP
jgi:hypothetical protein